DRELRLREAAQDRLADDRLDGGCALEQRPETAPAPARERHRRRRRAPLLHPAVVERDLLAERADVDELAVPVRRESHRALPRQKRPLADSARPRDGVPRDAHRRTIARVGADFQPLGLMMCVMSGYGYSVRWIRRMTSPARIT